METSPARNPWLVKRVVHELMAIWFGLIYAVSIISLRMASKYLRKRENMLTMLQTRTFAIQGICIHPEYNEPLLKELKERPAFAGQVH